MVLVWIDNLASKRVGLEKLQLKLKHLYQDNNDVLEYIF